MKKPNVNLKTLKDIKYIKSLFELNKESEHVKEMFNDDNYTAVNIDDLKKEAIRWIEELEKHNNNTEFFMKDENKNHPLYKYFTTF